MSTKRLDEHLALDNPPIDPKTRAIEAYLRASVEAVLRGAHETPRDGLLFLSSWHEALPAMVFLDPVLGPNDKVVFAVLWIWGRQNGHAGMAFPSYAYLMERCQIHSRATLSRCLAILRITRWVTLCRRVRDPAGHHRGNIYALHDEPLPLAGSLHLDPEYMRFLQTSAERHHHPRVRRVARAMRESIQGQIGDGEDVLADSATSQTERRLEAIEYLTGEHASGTPAIRYFGFRAGALQKLKQRAGKKRRTGDATPSALVVSSTPERSPVHFLPRKKSNSGLRSSSKNIYIKTTTTTEPESAPGGAELSTADAVSALTVPDFLTVNERALAEMYIVQAPSALRQPLLDELFGQVRSRKDTARPIRNPIGFLAWLCGEARQGRVHLTSLSAQVKARRDREQRLAAHEAEKTRRLTEQAKQVPKTSRWAQALESKGRAPRAPVAPV